MPRDWEAFVGVLGDEPTEHDHTVDLDDYDGPDAWELSDHYGEPVPVLQRGCGHTNRDPLIACCQDAARRELAGGNRERGAA